MPGAKRRSNLALAAVLGLIVLAVAAAVLFLRKPSREIGSLAVLPFANAGGDPNMEFFSDGVTESLINSLSQLPGLKVISRTSAFTYKGRRTDPKTVGKELGVRAVLVGSIARRGEDLAISAELVDTSDNSHLWGDQYNRKMSQIFAMQAEISQEIASALRLKLKGEENARLTRRYTNDTEAYQLYLKGRYHWNLFTEEGLKTAIRYYNEAIAKDPTYALAYTGLAASYGVLGANYWAPREAHPKSKAAIDRALEIDPSLPEAQGVLGAYELFYEWDWAAADKALRRAIAADPGNAGLYQLYSYYLWTAGRLEQALSNMQRAVELDPLSPVISGDLAWTHYFARQYDRAIEQFLKSQDLGPNYYFSYIALGFAYVQKGMFEEIIAMIRKGVPLAGESSQSLSYLGYAYGAANRVQEAKDVLRKLHEISRERYVSPYDIAMVYTGLGDKDQAFEWLDKAYQDRYTWLITLKVDPIFDSLRSDPRFTDLVRRVGLP